MSDAASNPWWTDILTLPARTVVEASHLGAQTPHSSRVILPTGSKVTPNGMLGLQFSVGRAGVEVVLALLPSLAGFADELSGIIAASARAYLALVSGEPPSLLATFSTGAVDVAASIEHYAEVSCERCGASLACTHVVTAMGRLRRSVMIQPRRIFAVFDIDYREICQRVVDLRGSQRSIENLLKNPGAQFPVAAKDYGWDLSPTRDRRELVHDYWASQVTFRERPYRGTSSRRDFLRVSDLALSLGVDDERGIFREGLREVYKEVAEAISTPP